jgi:hypothetical protein
MQGRRRRLWLQYPNKRSSRDLQKLVVAQLLTFPAFYEARSFINTSQEPLSCTSLYPDESKWITPQCKHTVGYLAAGIVLHCWYSQALDTCTVDTAMHRTLALLIQPSARHLHCWYSQAPDTCTVDTATVHTTQSAKCSQSQDTADISNFINSSPWLLVA